MLGFRRAVENVVASNGQAGAVLEKHFALSLQHHQHFLMLPGTVFPYGLLRLECDQPRPHRYRFRRAAQQWHIPLSPAVELQDFGMCLLFFLRERGDRR